MVLYWKSFGLAKESKEAKVVQTWWTIGGFACAIYQVVGGILATRRLRSEWCGERTTYPDSVPGGHTLPTMANW